MADRIVTSQDTPTALHIRLDDPVNRLLALQDLAGWISNARDLAECIGRRAADSPQLVKALHPTRPFSADWSDQAQNGLDYLNLVMAELVRTVRAEVDEEYQAARGLQQ